MPTTSDADAIGPNDIISVRGPYLYQRDGTRFFVKGVAFPVSVVETYNATAWVGILQQLNSLMGLEHYNTVRIYRMDPGIDYSEFFRAAAKLGVYVLVPLTAQWGDGVMDRRVPAPGCYDRKLFEYGVACLRNYLRCPNVLAGLLANEVMDSRQDSWRAAPCIKAYGRDLKLYMRRHNMRPLPLIYAAQHSGIGQVGDVGTMWLTLNYLTCSDGGGKSSSNLLLQDASSSPPPPVDIFGVNVESWCSSRASFVFNEDGSASSYYSLWLGLHQSTVPLVFTEMGCSHVQFDRDNGLHTPEGTRNWKQVEAVLHEMSDTWSGFCAYGYYGNSVFNMFKGGPWRSDPLLPTEDFYNFRDALARAADGGSHQDDPPADFERFFVPTCSQVEEELLSCCNLDLYPYSRIPSYALGLELEGAPLHKNADTARTFGARSMLTFGLAGVGLIGVLMTKVLRAYARQATYQTIM